jgi:hypothetical protein
MLRVCLPTFKLYVGFCFARISCQFVFLVLIVFVCVTFYLFGNSCIATKVLLHDDPPARRHFFYAPGPPERVCVCELDCVIFAAGILTLKHVRLCVIQLSFVYLYL